MKKFKLMYITFAVLVALSVIANHASAAIVSASGPNSSAGTAPEIITAPLHVLDDIVTNTGMQGFNEAQGVITTVAHSINAGGSIPAGTPVDSHMIFLNSEGGTGLIHTNVDWTFSGTIIGIMSNAAGSLEAASTFELGSPATNYTVTFPGSGPAAPYPNRGLEGGDSFLFLSPNTLRVTMTVSEPGDWIRVITLALIEVEIDVKPGSYPNSINPKAGGVIPVAILTTDTFDASTVDPQTVALEGVLAKEKGKSGKYGSLEDVDGDGDLDLVVQIPNTIDWAEDATEATLTGETLDGIPIEGIDSVRIVPPE